MKQLLVDLTDKNRLCIRAHQHQRTPLWRLRLFTLKQKIKGHWNVKPLEGCQLTPIIPKWGKDICSSGGCVHFVNKRTWNNC